MNLILNRLLQIFAFFIAGGGTLRPWLQKKRGVRIGKDVWIGQFVYIDQLYPDAVVIGDNCTIGLRSTIFTHLHWGARKSNNYGKVVIEKDVYIGPHCVILPNVTIGEGSVIRGGTVVSRNVPPHTFWGNESPGPLAKVSVPLTHEYSYEEFVQGLKPIRNKKNNH